MWATPSRNAGLGDAKTVVLQRRRETAYMNTEGDNVLATSTKVASWYQRSESCRRGRAPCFSQLTYRVPLTLPKGARPSTTRRGNARTGGDLNANTTT